MIAVYIGIILLYLMLAIISRKHFSKYKVEVRGDFISCIIGWWLAMGEIIFEVIHKKISWQKIKSRLRKLQVVSEKRLNQMAREYVIKNIAKCLGVLFCITVVAGIFCIKEMTVDESKNTIRREDYQGNEKEYEIHLDTSEESSVYMLEVSPLEYTEEEFQKQAKAILDDLETEILGENMDLAHIYSDPLLPDTDATGVFQIDWISESPEYISSSGRVFWGEISQGTWVFLRAEVKYLEYSASREYSLFLIPPDYGMELANLNMVKGILTNLEKESRNQDIITLPAEIEGVKISLQEKKENKSLRILFLGILFCFVMTAFQYSRLKSEGDLRDHLLMQLYPEFVNQLWLFLGTGMTIKTSIRKLVRRSKEKNILIRELEYALNQLDSGADEAATYDQLGVRLGVPSYVHLMNHISQNLRMGTRDLLRLMEDEVYASLEMRKELAKRKGEVASTKLLFPMMLLLAITMVIVIVPAIMNFR